VDVFVANEQDIPVDHDRLSTLAAHVLLREDVDDDAELSVLFVTPEHIRRLNAHFAGDDYPTDVLSFPMMESGDDGDDGPLLLGDVVVCPAVAERNAQKAGQSLAAELDVLVVHGTLHLLGYDHQGSQDRSEMERRQRDILMSFDPART
jgi:probable rRNA maturation factor